MPPALGRTPVVPFARCSPVACVILGCAAGAVVRLVGVPVRVGKCLAIRPGKSAFRCFVTQANPCVLTGGEKGCCQEIILAGSGHGSEVAIEVGGVGFGSCPVGSGGGKKIMMPVVSAQKGVAAELRGQAGGSRQVGGRRRIINRAVAGNDVAGASEDGRRVGHVHRERAVGRAVRPGDRGSARRESAAARQACGEDGGDWLRSRTWRCQFEDETAGGGRVEVVPKTICADFSIVLAVASVVRLAGSPVGVGLALVGCPVEIAFDSFVGVANPV